MVVIRTIDSEALQGNIGRALGTACLVHLLLLLVTWKLAPMLAVVFKPQASAPEVVEFHLAGLAADVEPSSRVNEPPPTPLVGEFASRARDRVEGDADTAVPAGGEIGPDNSLPGSVVLESRLESTPENVSKNATENPPGMSLESREVGRTRREAAVPSAEAMLTGRQETSRTAAASFGVGAHHRPEFGEGGALDVGDYAFSTQAWDYEPYWEHMRRRLYAAWHPPAAYAQYGLLRSGGWTLVRAVLEKDGRVSNAEIIDQQGHESLHRASLAAMLGAAPFRALPADFPDQTLVVTVRFIYLPPGQRAEAP